MAKSSKSKCRVGRRSILKCVPILFTIPFAVTSCMTGSTNNTEFLDYQGVGAPDNIITLTQDAVLTRNPVHTQYVVRDGAKLNLNGFELDGRNAAGKHFTAVHLHDGAEVFNGAISYAEHGVVVNTELGVGSWRQTLSAMAQRDRLPYVKTLQDTVNVSSSVDSVVFKLNRIGVYITGFSKDTLITNNEFIKGRLGIYIDTYSQYSFIDNNLFDEIGKDYTRKKYGFKLPYSREAIAVDNSSNNTISNNTFTGGVRGGIYLYKNCGELDPIGVSTPREGGSNDNKILNNCFKDMVSNVWYPRDEPAIWIASRWVDRLTTPCRADDEGDIVLRTILEGNTFKDVYYEVKEKG